MKFYITIILVSLFCLASTMSEAQNVSFNKLKGKANAQIVLDGYTINGFSNDVDLTDSSNLHLVTEAAVKAFIDNAIENNIVLITTAAPTGNAGYKIAVDTVGTDSLYVNNGYPSTADWDLFASGGSGVSDGDKGDLTISGTGTTYTIDADVVTLAKQASGTANRLQVFDASGNPSEGTVTGNATLSAGVLNVTGDGTGTDDQTAAEVTNTPAGNISATDVQAAINELDTEKLSAEEDGDISNELQTVANTSDATSHTVTLSDAGGSVKFIEGSNVTLTTSGTSSAGTVTIASTGGGTPGGSTTQVQYNNAGAFAGSAAITTDGTNLTLTGQLKNAAGTAGLPSYSFSGDTNTGLYSGGTDILSFSTTGSERMRIDAEGRVGIGKSPSAAYTLDVNGLSRMQTGFEVNRTGSDAYIQLLLNSVGVGQIRVESASVFGLGNNAGSVQMALNTTSGNVGIGTLTQVNKLDIEGAMAVGATYSGTTVAPTNGAIIEGDVGIGTTSPSEKLEVNGNIKATFAAAGAGTNAHVVSDGGVLKYRTTSQLANEISSDLADTVYISLCPVAKGTAITTTGELNDDYFVIPPSLDGWTLARADYALTANTATTGTMQMGISRYTSSNSLSGVSFLATFTTSDVRKNASSGLSVVSGDYYIAKVNTESFDNNAEGMSVTLTFVK